MRWDMMTLTRRQFALLFELRDQGGRDIEGLRASTYAPLVDAGLVVETTAGWLKISRHGLMTEALVHNTVRHPVLDATREEALPELLALLHRPMFVQRFIATKDLDTALGEDEIVEELAWAIKQTPLAQDIVTRTYGAACHGPSHNPLMASAIRKAVDMAEVAWSLS